MRCPEYYDESGKKNTIWETPIPMCKANGMKVIPSTMLNVCEHNCMSCSNYQRKNAGKPPERVAATYAQQEPKKSGVGGLLFLGVVIFVALKYFKII